MKRSFPLLTMLLLLPLTAFGQAKSSWIGQRVFTRFETVLKVGNQVVDDEKRRTNLSVSGRDSIVLRVYRVERVNGDWLWLKAENEGVEGWVKAEYVIRYNQALGYFTNQIRANPNELAWYIRRGSVWSEKGEYDIAIADYNEAIRLDPSDGTAWNDRGNAWNYKREYDKAIADLNEAVRLDPSDGIAWINRGNAWNYKREYDKAIADYSEAIRLDPKNVAAWNSRGFARNYKKEYDKAIADYNKAIRLDPKYVRAYKGRGSVWNVKKDYDKAITDYNEAIRLEPEFAAVYNGRAWLRATCPEEKYRDGKKAFEDACQACQLDNYKAADSIDTLAAAYAECGDFEKAVEWQEKANKMFTDAEDKQEGEERLKLYRSNKAYRQEG
jgi:tetratricopeptide (TPR) repeat protein